MTMVQEKAAQVSTDIFDKNEGLPVKVSGTLISAEKFDKAGTSRVEVRLSPAVVTNIDGTVRNRERYTISYFISDKYDGWRPQRVALCVMGGVSNFLDLIGRNLTFSIETREAEGKSYTDHKPTSITEATPTHQVSEAEALALVNGKTPNEVLALGTQLGTFAKVMTVKPTFLKTYTGRVTLGGDGRYHVA